MKILSCKVEWNKKWLNAPRLQVLVDRIPSIDELTYKKHVRSKFRTLWFAEKDGYVSHFSENRLDHTGLGGSVVTINTENDGVVKLHGPWITSDVEMSMYFTECMTVSLTDKPAVMRKGYTFMSACITLDATKEAVSKIYEPVQLIPVLWYEDAVVHRVRILNDCTHDIGHNDRCTKCGHKAYVKIGKYYKEVERQCG